MDGAFSVEELLTKGTMDESSELRLLFHRLNNQLGIIVAHAELLEAKATDGMSRQNRALFAMARRVPPLARASLSVMGMIATRWPQRAIEQMKRAMPPPDRAVLEQPGMADRFAEDVAEAFRCGSRGATWEAQLYARPWGFRLEDIAMEVHLWQGGEDVNVAPSMGRYQAQAIPNGKLTFYENEGHLVGITHLDEILATVTSSRA